MEDVDQDSSSDANNVYRKLERSKAISNDQSEALVKSIRSVPDESILPVGYAQEV